HTVALKQGLGEDQQHLAVAKLLEVIFTLELGCLDGFIQEFAEHVAGASRAAACETWKDRLEPTLLEDVAAGDDERHRHSGIPVLEFTRQRIVSLEQRRTGNG